MADTGEGEKKVKKKGWQPKRADWRAGGSEVCCVCVFACVIGVETEKQMVPMYCV